MIDRLYRAGVEELSSCCRNGEAEEGGEKAARLGWGRKSGRVERERERSFRARYRQFEEQEIEIRG